MKAAAFRYHRPASVAEALAVLRAGLGGLDDGGADDGGGGGGTDGMGGVDESNGTSGIGGGGGEVKVLAGGQSLLPVMNLRLSRPDVLVDLGALPELERLFADTDSLLIGALVRHRTLELDPLVRRRQPLLSAAARHIGHVGIRNRGTLGGTLAHADPAAELPLVTSVLGATAYLESTERGRRAVPVRELFTTYFTTVLREDEILTWVKVPVLAPGEGWGFHEYAPRHGDFALAGAAATVLLDDGGRVRRLRAGALAVGEVPVVFDGLGVGERAGEQLWDELAREWSVTLRPPDDDPDYTRHLAYQALRRALTQAAGNGSGSNGTGGSGTGGSGTVR